MLNEMFFGAAPSSGPGPGPIDEANSLRFNRDDSSELNRSFSSDGNRRTWTWSSWVKRSVLDIKNQRLLYVDGGDDSTYLELRTVENDRLCLSGFSTLFRTTDALFRDPAAWFHLVVACDTTQGNESDRIKFYVNGVQQTFLSSETQAVAQNAELAFGRASEHKIGYQYGGYLSEIHYVDGQYLTPDDFGFFDESNVWQPKAYTGTHGTNGYYLNFSDPDDIGNDAVGNNNWTPVNLLPEDVVVDNPTNNFCTLNPLASWRSTISNGNLEWYSATTYGQTQSTIAVSSGKWYYEATITTASMLLGIKSVAAPVPGTAWEGNRAYYSTDGRKFEDGTATTYGSPYVSGDIIGVALDMDVGELTFYKNGVSQGVAFVGITEPQLLGYCGSNGNPARASFNFGQRPFAYPAPSGFKSLCTTNLPDPAIADGSTAMDIAIYAGDSTSNRQINVNHSTDLVWIKTRNISDNHILADSVRGVNQILYTNKTFAERSEADSVTSFDSSGFTVSNNAGAAATNFATYSYVGWSWDAGDTTVTNTDGSITSNVRANPSAGFSIVTWTPPSSGPSTIGHGLGAAPEFIITKDRDNAYGWTIYHEFLGSGSYLDFTTAAYGASGNIFSTAPTNVVFDPGNQIEANNGYGDFIAYCWAPVEGYSSFGSYEGYVNVGEGPFIYTGHKPRWIMVKRIDTDVSSHWWIWDTARLTYNATDNPLFANLPSPELTPYSIDILSNGFKVRDTNPAINAAGGTFVFASFAEHPFKHSRAR